MTKVEIDFKDISPLVSMLYLSNELAVYKRGNYVKKRKKSVEFGNTCIDYQDFMYEKFGIYLDNNCLSEKNKQELGFGHRL